MLTLPDFIPPTTAGLLPCVGQATLFDTPDTLDQAQAICHTCPARTACDTWATEQQEWGTWAGRTDDQRGTPHTELPDTPTLPAEPGPDCGTEAQRRRHIAYQETCEVCDVARAERVRARRIRDLDAQHALPAAGSRWGYRLHALLGIPSCPPCRAAHSQEVTQVKRRTSVLAA
ncbi:WhiB family transcriptional regulator [Saccharothrix sp. ST-888]|uniref:WhiB family transcriptional regulator n=1 Tax=Saccharothrix sp. ST-888 TaxID=1427391 RepID=UPI0005ED285F|nr:WhiB family transcriptional regulator [Saccharothrix sp. ST-888]KJK55197.1 hypothetical protein UK12_30175 [Saccharothrix sp. ST-888]